LRRQLAALAGLVVVTLALRPQIIGIGPLVPAMRADLEMSHGVAGLLGTIPVLCMGVFAPFGPALARRLGPRRAIAWCIAAIAVFGLLRAIVPSVPLILAATFWIGVGTGVVGPVLAMLVRLRTPDRPALGTGAYASGTVVGATVAAAIAVPIAGPSSDWRLALSAFSVAALVSAAGWLLVVPPDGPDTRVDVAPLRLPWRSATAWMLAVVFGLQSVLYFATTAWVPSVYVERGWSEGDAANLLTTINAVGLITVIGVPLVADRAGTRRMQLLITAGSTLVAIGGFVAAPNLAVAWAVLLGLSLGAIFPLALTLPVDVSDDARDVGSTAAFMLLAGYALSSAGPVALGIARDLTGDFTASLWLLFLLAVSLLASCAALSPGRLWRGIGRPTFEAPGPPAR
jgi:CP family cyanate transporter-like MFS transporter